MKKNIISYVFCLNICLFNLINISAVHVYTYDQLKDKIAKQAEFSFGIPSASKNYKDINFDYKNWKSDAEKDIKMHSWNMLLNDVRDFVYKFSEVSNYDLLRCYLSKTEKEYEKFCEEYFKKEEIYTIFELTNLLFDVLKKLSERLNKKEISEDKFYQDFNNIVFNPGNQSPVAQLGGFEPKLIELKQYVMHNSNRKSLTDQTNSIWLTKPSDSKKLILNIIDIYEKVLNNIILDYSFSPESILKELEDRFDKFNYKDKQDILSEKKLQVWFLKSLYLVSKSINKDLKDQFEKTYEVYLNTQKLIKQLSLKNQLDSASSISENIAAIKKIGQALNKIKIENKPDEKNAEKIIRGLLKLYEVVIQKIKKEFVESYDLVLQDIAVAKINALSIDFSLAIDAERLKILKYTLGQMRLFVAFSGSTDLPKIFDQYMGYLESVVSLINDLASNKQQLDLLNEKDRTSRLDKVYASINDQLKKAEKLVNNITTFFEGPRSAKKIMLYMLENYKNAFEKFKKDMENYYKKNIKKAQIV